MWLIRGAFFWLLVAAVVDVYYGVRAATEPELVGQLQLDASRHAIAEHHQMDEMVEDLEGNDLTGTGWMAGARKLVEKVEHHLKEEETKFFQLAGKVLSEEQKVRLAREYEAEFLTLRTKD